MYAWLLATVVVLCRYDDRLRMTSSSRSQRAGFETVMQEKSTSVSSLKWSACGIRPPRLAPRSEPSEHLHGLPANKSGKEQERLDIGLEMVPRVSC
jgi:hypothetical protein